MGKKYKYKYKYTYKYKYKYTAQKHNTNIFSSKEVPEKPTMCQNVSNNYKKTLDSICNVCRFSEKKSVCKVEAEQVWVEQAMIVLLILTGGNELGIIFSSIFFQTNFL